MKITLRNQTITYKESTQFLGIKLDSRLNWNWKEYIYRVTAKGKTALNTINVLAGKMWGRDQITLKRLYSAICRSKIDYDCQLYSISSL